MKQILLNTEGLQTRVAVVENGRLQDFFIERHESDRLVGSIFKGRVKNLEPSLQAAFVDIGAEKNAFLHYWDMLPATHEMLEDGDGDEDERDADEADEDDGDDTGSTDAAIPREEKRSILDSLKDRLLPRKAAPVERRPQRRSRPRFTVEDIPNLFKVDSEVVVQVTKGPIGTKGARVTTNLSIPGRYLVLLPRSGHVGVSKRIDDPKERDRLRQILKHLNLPENMGLICRTVGAGKKERYFESDVEMLLDFWNQAEKAIETERAPVCVYQEPDLVERSLRDYLSEDIDEIVADSKPTFDFVQRLARKLSKQERVRVKLHDNPRPLFQKYNLEEQIESVFRRQVPLPSGGWLCIDETEALIAIDVNSGKNRAGKDHPETIVNTNMEAVDEVARQLRLRNVGGLVVVDLIDMRSRKDQQDVYKALKQALLEDKAKTKAYPITPLGLIEMTRQREHESLRSTVYSPCPYCSGKGVVKSATTVSSEIQRRLREILKRRRTRMALRIMVHPTVLERLRNEDANLLTTMEQDFGGELSFRADPALHQEEFRLVDLTTGDEL